MLSCIVSMCSVCETASFRAHHGVRGPVAPRPRQRLVVSLSATWATLTGVWQRPQGLHGCRLTPGTARVFSGIPLSEQPLGVFVRLNCWGFY